MNNFEKLIKTIVNPLVKYPNDIKINLRETDMFHEYILSTNPKDLGRIIGKKGHIIQTVRTIVYSVHVNDDKRVKLVVNDGKN
ncbi:KH domain-containing protein [Lactobacillus sp. S2-2]|uniref:KH domain-containing protein n=1 Tax=Lactobacillus sp. S2-2 TaxID=2692917 RepID=UPI001F4660B5|nr:KH domain-containing protein [Lactobacillus sp. S2-2]MCF6515082.1 KH domain-containing protein [Lactobacillus sp. S2-2]